MNSNQKNHTFEDTHEINDSSGSLKTLLAAVFTGLVFWSSLFALLFFCLTS